VEFADRDRSSSATPIPLNAKEGDREQRFQFQAGTAF
jgi:outer membrane protein assembly factor BamA